MTDLLLDDPAFIGAVRATFEDLAPAAAPESLRASVGAVPLRHRQGGAARRRLWFAAGIAATVLIAVGVAGLVLGLPRGPMGVLGPSTLPTGNPTASTGAFTFRVVPADGSTATKAQVEAVSEVMASRLRAYGIGNFSSSASDDRITFELDMPDAGDRSSIRSLLGSTGMLSFGRPVVAAPELGSRLEEPPLLSRDAFTDVQLGSNQTGQQTVDLTLDAAGASALAESTRTHVGDYLPVALDGSVIMTPVIREEIAGGQVQLQSATDPTEAARLVAILQGGPLPVPVAAVAP